MFKLADALAAIQGKPEFNHNIRDGFSVIDYSIKTPETFNGKNAQESMILHNLRGTKFDTEGNIICLAYHSFFNYGEKEVNIDMTKAHSVLVKLDGSMISPIWVNGSYRLTTRAGVTEVAEKAEDYLNNCDKFSAYERFLEECERYGDTPIFEFCSRNQRIVIDYPVSSLTLTAIRNRNTGKYKPYSELKKIAQYYNLPLVEEFSSNGDINSLVQVIRNLPGDQEGVVIRFDDGLFIKIKGEEYVRIHSALDGCRHEKNVIKTILNGNLDDVLPIVDKATKDRLNAFSGSLLGSIKQKENDIRKEYSNISQIESQKDFAEQAKKSKQSKFLFDLHRGKDIDLKSFVLKKCGSQTDVDSIRDFVGKSWYEF